MKKLNYKFFLCLTLIVGLNFNSFARMNVGNRTTQPSNGNRVASTCPNTTAQLDLNINNVRARILNGGDLWWDPVGQIPYYEVPSGSNKNCIYTGALWIGGIDASGQLKVAGQTYRQDGNDFWGGPISRSGPSPTGDITLAKCLEFDRFYSITREEVETFIADPTAATDAIKEWPGNGNVADGELPQLAPYFDSNNDGEYSWEDGDYPYFFFGEEYPVDPCAGTQVCDDYLFGDKTIWWVFNDVGNVKTETNSDPIGLEIRAQAFAFKTNDAINNMTFYKYQIINRSSDSLSDTYFGVWCDPDLGNASDDYVGCDVGLGLGFVYNGDPDDDGGSGYGLNPPAVGIDFFQGPLADTGDGIDNDKDGAVDECGEQIIMSKFMYYVNVNGIATGNPAVTDDYYDYLIGQWLDGTIVTYGGDGRNPGCGNTGNPCNYMFPDNTDPDFSTTWNMQNGCIQPTDMRFLQSAGAFSLAPGAVNYIATGVVWARATNGGPLASVKAMKSADILAQQLFNNCFKVKDGPAAPDLAIRELDQQLIISIENYTKSENFVFKDPNIPGVIRIDSSTVDTLTDLERSYTFEGYQLYQVTDPTVAADQLTDESKAKLVAQVDLKNNFVKLVNYTKNDEFGFYEPEVKTIESNTGIQHTIVLTQDLFRQKTFANYRPVYYLLVAYAANNFNPFDQSVANFEQNTQAQTYLSGRKNVKVYSAIPHKPEVQNMGTTFRSEYGTGLSVRRIEGAGNGGNVLDLTSETVNEILTSPLNRALHPAYEPGRGPIAATVYDPMKVKAGKFTLAFDDILSTSSWSLLDNPRKLVSIGNVTATGLVLSISSATAHGLKSGQYVTVKDVAGLLPSTAVNTTFTVSRVVDEFTYEVATSVAVTGAYTSGTGTFENNLTRSAAPLGSGNDELYSPNSVKFAVTADSLRNPGLPTAVNNGFLEATQEFSNPSNAWLTGVVDGETAGAANNWIASGSGTGDLPDDPNSVYETVLGGTWAPYKMVQKTGPAAVKFNNPAIETLIKWTSLASVDVVLTSNKDLWTRTVVFETGNYPALNINSAAKFDKRKSPSVDKNGNPGDGIVSSDPNDADFIDSVGMGWFPGYAINVETGERLNIAFGENSSLVGENSRDMLFNPTSNQGNDDNDSLSFGGMHYIYVFNKNGTGNTDVPIYDFGAKIDELIGNGSSSVGKRNVFKDCIWATIPILASGQTLLSSDAKIRLRTHREYRKFLSTGDVATNGTNPLYEIEVDGGFEALTNQSGVATSALDNIRVVPNPYYAYSSYERTRKDQLDNRVRITNLPSKCTVSIYTMNGVLVRQLRRSVLADESQGEATTKGLDFNLAKTLDWDLKNTAGITVASGVYIIHIDGGDIGEKIIKWFGIMRPIDLDSF